MASEVDNLYARYRSELKPLVAEYESQNEQIMPSCLVNLAQMFDRIALSESEQSIKALKNILYDLNEELEPITQDEEIDESMVMC